jgi:catechol 2,3-dioxygenase-like lactoylglutathione lyase family enzyme
MTRIHLSFPTRDLAASTAFYETLFATPPDKTHPDHVRFQPEAVPITLALTPDPDARAAPGTAHQGIKLADVEAVRTAVARFEAAGLPLRTEQTDCCYAGLDRVWVVDPDGRPWEVYTVLEDTGVALAPSSGTCCVKEPETEASSSCC